eukprot:426275-Rhodomonas_salina.1
MDGWREGGPGGTVGAREGGGKGERERGLEPAFGSSAQHGFSQLSLQGMKGMLFMVLFELSEAGQWDTISSNQARASVRPRLKLRVPLGVKGT